MINGEFIQLSSNQLYDINGGMPILLGVLAAVVIVAAAAVVVCCAVVLVAKVGQALSDAIG